MTSDDDPSTPPPHLAPTAAAAGRGRRSTAAPGRGAGRGRRRTAAPGRGAACGRRGAAPGRGAARPNLPNDINAPSQVFVYHRVLLSLMNYTYRQQCPPSEKFPPNKVFLQHELTSLTPDDI